MTSTAQPSPTFVMRFRTKNDINGNPRRVYVAFCGTAVLGAWDEGYSGVYAVPDAFRYLAYDCPTVDVPVTEYRRLLQRHTFG